MHDWLAIVVSFIVPAIQAVGVAIVVWGVVEALGTLLRRAWERSSARIAHIGLDDIRLTVGDRLVLALEFFVAGDIIQTVVVPSWESLGILAGIVAIRTVLVYFLEWELRSGTRPPASSSEVSRVS